ncbi:MAG: hypothetical protein WCD02_16360, partial [Terriglobales bacterium]
MEIIPLQAERHSGNRQRLFGLPPESVFSFRPECCSASQRNGVQFQTGIAFTFDRIPHEMRNRAIAVTLSFFIAAPFSVPSIVQWMRPV